MNRSFDNRRSGGDNGQYGSPWNQGDQGFRGGFQGRNRFRQSKFSPQNQQNHRGRNNQSFQGRRDIPISDYYHPSMLEDPWAELLGKVKSQESTDPPPKSPKEEEN